MKPTRMMMLLTTILALAGSATAATPNVLFIAVDDLRVELGCYGSEHVLSPNIDRLATQGTLFGRAYCQQTVCNPSRASLLTGLRPDQLKIWDLPTHFRERNPDIVTLPQLFKQSGYHSQCIGKIFHNWRQDKWKGDRASWSVPSVLHYNSHSNDKPLVTGPIPPNSASGKGGLECRDVPDEAYFDGRVANQAVETLEAIGKSGEPFFLAIGFWKPHTPFNAPKKYWDLYDRDQIDVPDDITPPTNVPAIALTSSRIAKDTSDDDLREMHHGHLAAVSYLDTQVGKVLNKLDEIGRSDDTIVVLWSDHGLHLGEHGLTRKTTAFELDARVPLIIRTPVALLKQGTTPQKTDSIVELVDIYPTLVELCNLRAPHQLAGDSLVPILETGIVTDGTTDKPCAMTQTTRPSYPKGKDPDVMGYSLRTDHYRLTEWRDFKTGELVASELYRHLDDPKETRNIADDPAVASIRKALSRTLSTYLPANNDSEAAVSLEPQ